MITKFIQSAAVAIAIVVTAPISSAQDREKPDAEKPQKPKPRETAPEPASGRDRDKLQPERGMRKDGDRENGRRPDANRDQSKDSRPRDPRADNQPSEDTRTFLGVATSSVHPVLLEHLGLDYGFGIQVEQVLDDSPAGKAGLKKSDILTMIDDQRLIGPEHLSLLVRSMDSGDKVTLTFIRKGKEQTVDLELGEKAESDFGPVGRGPGPREPWRESMERNQDYWRGWMEQNRRGERDEFESYRDRKTLPEGRPPAVSVRPGFPVNIFGASGIMKIDNDEGELTITEENGAHRIVIEDKEGVTVYEGDFDPEAGVEGLPDKAQKQLKVMKLDNLEILTPPTEEKAPKKTSGPPRPRSGGQPL